MLSLLFYNLQNTFKKICIFLRQVKIAIGWKEYKLKLDSGSLLINFRFEVLQFNHSFKYIKLTNQVK